MSDDFKPKPGQSFLEMLNAEMQAKRRLVELAKDKPDSTGTPYVQEECPECGASAINKESFGVLIGVAAKRSTPDGDGVVTVTCRVCEFQWKEDDHYIKMVKETRLS